MTAIVAGLNSTPIHRLKRSWNEIKPKAMTIFQQLEALVQSWKNLAEFRRTMAEVTGPCVPFLGMRLSN
jgi:son of sevenless